MKAHPVLQHPELEGGPFYWKGGPVGILLLHGMTATTAEVRPLAKWLHERGFTVAGPLLPGHGTTPADLSRTKWTDWAGAADDAYQYLSISVEHVFVAGSSMGGLLALYLASQHPDICGLLLYAPAFHIPGIQTARFLAYFKTYINKKSTDDSMPWKGYYVNPVRSAAELYRLQQEVRRRLPRITQPALILQGELDQTIDPRSAQMVFDGLPSTRKELHWLKHSTHVLILDREFDLAAEFTLKFINRTIEDQV